MGIKLIVKQGDVLYQVQNATIISNEEDIIIFSDVLFDKCYDLYGCIFYILYPIGTGRIK